MVKLTRAEFVQLLLTVGNQTVLNCYLTTKTVPTMVGPKGEQPKDLFKVARVKFTLNAIYENKVNRQLTKEGADTAGEFETAGDPAWKKRISRHLSYHRTNKNQWYFDYMPETVPDLVYQQGGQNVPKSAIVKYLKERDDNSYRQGTETKVEFRACKVDSIVSLEMRGETYVVQDDYADCAH